MEPLFPEQPPRWLLAKYRDGRCSAGETAIVDAWFDGEAADITSPTERQDIETVHLQVMQTIIAARRSRNRLWGGLSAAAAACLLLMAGAWYFMRAKTAPVYPANMLTVKADAGQQKRVTLPDGSSVLLNSCSQIRFFPSFLEFRQVYLQGEAFFDVQRAADKPFRVVTDSVQVMVLGTRFNLAGYAGSSVQVTLESGKVAVYKASDKNLTGKNAVLQPGEMLQYVQDELRVKPADMEAALAWQQGLLLYRNLTLSDICKDLERRYHVNIQINSRQAASRRYHYKSRQIPLAAVFKVLSETGKGFRYKINQQDIIIY
nr:FecR family protein [uncultured Chitinophaga sp.]